MRLARCLMRKTPSRFKAFVCGMLTRRDCHWMAGKNCNFCRMPSEMASITPCCGNATRRRLLSAALIAPLLAFGPSAVARDDAQMRSAGILYVDDVYVLNADFDVPLS